MRTRVPPIAIVVSRYNDSITSELLAGAIDVYKDAGGDKKFLGVIDAPGAFDLTGICRAAARSGLYDGVVALGCVIQGDTRHDRYINEAVAHGLTQITLDTGVPVGLGVLTVKTRAQAQARSGGLLGNKGVDAMIAVLESVAAITAIDAAGGKPGLTHRLSVEPHEKDGA